VAVAGAGQGKGLYGAVREVAAEGADEGAHGGTGGEDVVDEEEGGGGGEVGGAWRGGGRVDVRRGGGRGELVDVLELGASLVAGQVFAREGRPGLGKEGGEVMAAEADGKGVAKEVEGGWKVHTGGCFIVAEGAEDDGVGGEGQGAKQLDGAIDPGIEVGLDALFEIEQAMGKGIGSGCQWKIGTEVEVGEESVPAFYFGCQQPHDLNLLYSGRILRRWLGPSSGLLRHAPPWSYPSFLGYAPGGPARRRSPSRSARQVRATTRIAGSGKRKRSPI
jgi:hypothetical protein